jgi:hypothetical protein
MPSPAETFQGISGSQPGPFSDYLNPVQTRPIDQPQSRATGYETPAVGAGKIALNFLQGIRQSRVANYYQQELQHQRGFDAYKSHIEDLARDPDIAPGGAEAIRALGNQTLLQHTTEQAKDAPDHGVLGVLKGAFTNMVGGKLPKTEPVDFEKEAGRASLEAKKYSQRANFGQAATEAKQAIATLQQQNPNRPLTQEEVIRAVQPSYLKVLQNAPNYAGQFVPAMTAGYYPAGSYEGQSQMLMAPSLSAPATEPPPGAQPGGIEGIVRQNLGMVLPEAPTAAARPAAAGPQYAVPLNSPQRYATLTGMAGLRNSRINISPRQRYITQGGSAFTGHEISGSPETADNGIWNAETGQKVTESAIPMTAAGRTPYTEAGTGKTYYVDPFTGKMAPFQKESGGEFERSQAEDIVQLADGSYARVPRGAPLPTGARPVAAATAAIRENAADRRQRLSLSEARYRQQVGIGAQTTRDFRGMGQRTAAAYDRMIASAKAANVRQVNAQALQSGAPVPQNLLEGGEKNTKALVDWLEKEKAADLKEIDSMASEEGGTEPPPAAPAKAKAPKAGAPKTAAPPATTGKTVKGASLLE